jgi:CRISPR-associated protein Cmr2
MNEYTAVTFAPVQGFIEKSRKLRDLYGASLILSYLSQQLVLSVKKNGLKVISPAIPNLQKGMPNRILIKGEMSKKEAETVILSAWKEMLKVCREWIQYDKLSEKKFPEFIYHWEREWTLWGCHTWEIFHGTGCCIEAAMNDLETNKLSRDWSAVNWIGESSSLTGTDAIAFPGLGAETRNPKNMNYGNENKEIEKFYQKLAEITENKDEENTQGKFIALNEKLSIPELVKRLVTLPEIADLISEDKSKDEKLEQLKGFQEIERKPDPSKDIPGQWTGWFMGDGDEVGDHLKDLAKKENGDDKIHQFSDAIRDWGKDFNKEFPEDLGRIVYAGGDDFLGIIYSKNSAEPIPAFEAYQWLLTLNKTWKKHGQEKITVSVGFVWVAGSVPQRDVLQHCREAEKVAKSLGRDRVTIRVVFNSGQYVQWTCPWDYLHILQKYKDRNGNTYEKWELRGRDKKYKPNWNHIYSDLAQLKARHAIDLNTTLNSQGGKINDIYDIALVLFNIYFNDGEFLEKNALKIVNDDSSLKIVSWINDLINVGWKLCTDI